MFLPSGRKWKKVENMFFGSYLHTLDDKGRLVIPYKLRSNVSSRLYILKGYEGSLSLYCENDFGLYLDKLKKLSYESKSCRDVERVALSSVNELELDSQNRIQIPSSLLKKYAIGKEVVVVGVLDHIEIWDKAKWDTYLGENEKDFEEKSESLLKSHD